MLSDYSTYFIVGSRVVRPGQVYTVSVNVLQAPLPITVRASISRNRVELTTDSKDVKEGIPEKLIMRVCIALFMAFIFNNQRLQMI